MKNDVQNVKGTVSCLGITEYILERCSGGKMKGGNITEDNVLVMAKVQDVAKA